MVPWTGEEKRQRALITIAPEAIADMKVVVTEYRYDQGKYLKKV